MRTGKISNVKDAKKRMAELEQEVPKYEILLKKTNNSLAEVKKELNKLKSYIGSKKKKVDE
tara:strand:+ start:5475 stop:5657 length:183 start_codon:yes stop_codon:yes gene_type:complete